MSTDRSCARLIRMSAMIVVTSFTRTRRIRPVSWWWCHMKPNIFSDPPFNSFNCAGIIWDAQTSLLLICFPSSLVAIRSCRIVTPVLGVRNHWTTSQSHLFDLRTFMLFTLSMVWLYPQWMVVVACLLGSQACLYQRLSNGSSRRICTAHFNMAKAWKLLSLT